MQNKHETFFSFFGGPTYGEGGGGGPLVGPKAQVFPKINFDGTPYSLGAFFTTTSSGSFFRSPIRTVCQTRVSQQAFQKTSQRYIFQNMSEVFSCCSLKQMCNSYKNSKFPKSLQQSISCSFLLLSYTVLHSNADLINVVFQSSHLHIVLNISQG